jgi:myo-inositol-1(or 4)-monophosphatase
VAAPAPDPDLLAEIALAAASAAGALLLERFDEPATGIGRKSSATDMVSDADRDAERLIRDLLKGARPGDSILGEEEGTLPGETGLLWVVDPLDGTTNFLYRQPVWSVSIACEDRDGALAGVVHQPFTDEIYVAKRGHGAWMNGSRITVSDQDDLSRSLIGTGFAYTADAREAQARTLVEILPSVRDVRRGGSAAIDLAWVASGRLDGFYELGIHRWDRAAGELLVREAGGVVTHLEPVGDSGDGVLAAGPSLHAALSSLVSGALLH